MVKLSRRALVATVVVAICVASAVAIVLATRSPMVPADSTVAEPPGVGPLNPPGNRPGRGEVFPYNRVVVVAIGIDRYPNAVPACDLKQAESDTRSIAEVFEKQFGYEVVSLLGAAATKDRIRETIERYGNELGERDALIVYFAGHGRVVELPGAGEAGYLVPVEAAVDIRNGTDAPRWQSQALNMRELVDRLNQAGAGQVLVIADACCSGFLTSTRGALADFDLKNFLVRRSRTVLAATTRNQNAEDGQFTRKLVEQLRQLDPPKGRPKAASVYDLFQPLLKDVSRDTSGRMTPQLAQVGDGDGMFVFIPASVPRAELEVDLRKFEATRPLLDGSGTIDPVIRRRREQIQQFTSPVDVFALTEVIDYRHAADAENRRVVWEGRFERFRRNALVGDVWAMAALHFCYDIGLGTEKSPELSYYWAQQVNRAQKPAGLGRFLLGRCYESNIGVPLTGEPAKVMSRRLYQESADAGCELGHYGLGISLLSGKPSNDEILQGRKHLEAARAGKVPAAEVSFAVELLREHPFLPRDPARGLELLEQAAKREHAGALRRLAYYYSRGDKSDPPKDLKRAERYLRQSADLGSPIAMATIGEAYRDGPKGQYGFPKDDRQAFTFFDRAASAGNAYGMVESARLLAGGTGVEPNPLLAQNRILAAARTGDNYANSLLGCWYRDGYVFDQSDADALRCFRRAADNGDARASLMAGRMYSQGRGFKVQRQTWGKFADENFFHHDWHMALHYLARSHMLSLENRQSEDDITIEMYGFKAALVGDEKEFRFLYGAPQGGKKNEFVSDPWFAFCSLQATACAKKWKELYPDSFAWFCKATKVDPNSFERLDKPEKSPADK